MSGLGETGNLPGFVTAGNQAQAKDLDILVDIGVDSPSVSQTWFGTAAGGTATVAKPLVLISQLADWPRNALYSVVGTNTIGGTWQVYGVDQFGNSQSETVVIGTAAAGTPAGSVYGTVIWAKILSGTFTATSTSVGLGSAQLGVGTNSNGSAQSNWFGLLYKIKGTADVKSLTWVTTNTPTALNAGTAIGTLIGFDSNGSLPSNAFQGTSGVANTDHYKVFVKPTFDMVGKGNMINL